MIMKIKKTAKNHRSSSFIKKNKLFVIITQMTAFSQKTITDNFIKN